MKKALPLILILASVKFALAGSVGVESARQVALNFFKLNVPASKTTYSATLNLTRSENDGTIDFYVFDILPGKGFVIVAGNDNIQPILGYSTESNFNGNTTRVGIKDWMDHAAEHISTAVHQNVAANQRISGLWSAYNQSRKTASARGTGVSPLVTTTWDQEPYYNQYCPYNSTDQEQCLTGCVATAMAQIMKYWNYPAQGTGSYAYNDLPPMFNNTYGVQSANFGSTSYQWDSMPTILTSNNSAVATLMRQCGVAVAMDYGDDYQGGSGAYVVQAQTASWRKTAQYAYTNYFSYDARTLQGIIEANYTSAAWLSLIEGELDAGRPVQYVGLDTIVGGHSWVCDGYDGNNFLHMNWGWSGVDNGYYAIDNLSAAGMNFSNKEAALIGIQPIVNVTVTATTADSVICAGDSTVLTAIGSSAATYSWQPVTGLECATCAVTTASPSVNTIYTVTIDSAGFKSTSSITVYVNARVTPDSVVVPVGARHVSGNASLQLRAPITGTAVSGISSFLSSFVSVADTFSAPATPAVLSQSNGCSSSHTTATHNRLQSSFSYQPSDSVYGGGPSDVTINGNKNNNAQNVLLTMQVYPNPAASRLSLQLSQLNDGTQLKVMDITGRVIMTQTLNSVQTQLDVSNLSTGTYFAQVLQGGQTLVKQFVVAH